MLLHVDVKELIKHKVTIDEYIVINLLYDKQYGILSSYLALYSIVEKESLFSKLAKSGLVINNNPPNEYDTAYMELLPWSNIVLAKGDYFDELLEIYPASTIRPDGSKDYLKTDTNRCRAAYLKITKGNQSLHNHIVECLKYELEIKKSSNSMKFMKRLPKWLASEEWKVTEQYMKDDKKNANNLTELGYGNNLI